MKWIIPLALLITLIHGAPTDSHSHKEEVAGGDLNSLAESSTQSERRVITYDQRQEGKFNVRADLENFVIVFVPSSPSQGMNLLEMLGNMRRSQSKHSHKKRIHSSHEKDSNTIEIHKEPQYSPVDHFIEGRTPYRVDINSEPSALSHLHPEMVKTESVTISPVLKLVKQGSLTIEQPSVQITEGNTRDKRSLSASSPPQVVGASFADTNSVVVSSSDLVDSSGDGEDLSPYLKQLTDPIHSFDSLITADKDYFMSDDWRLLGAATEACGPDMRRDSYGICRFYPTTF